MLYNWTDGRSFFQKTRLYRVHMKATSVSSRHPGLLLVPSFCCPPLHESGTLQIFKTGSTLGLPTNYYLSRLAKMYSCPSTQPFLPSLPVNGCFVWGSGFQSGCGRDAVAALHRSITVCEITVESKAHVCQVDKDPRQWGLTAVEDNRDNSTVTDESFWLLNWGYNFLIALLFVFLFLQQKCYPVLWLSSHASV